jgi:CRISPR/Cas system CSM-associated protein Csm3 (group 7 of RAMP superfamily)
MTERILEIRFLSASHHGSGFGLAGLVDRAVLRDCNGTPYLAGSAIKGRMRHAALRVQLADGERACEYGDQSNVCMDGEPCAICTLFGSVYRSAQLAFSDAYPAEEIRQVMENLWKAGRGRVLPVDSSVRRGTALDRQLGTVRRQLLFSTETLPDWLTFRGTICGDAGGYEELLQQAARVLTHFGAGAARGLGRSEWRLL